MSNYTVLRNIKVLYQCLPQGLQCDVQPIEQAALVWGGTTIQWVGREKDLPVQYQRAPAYDAGGGIAIPGLIDCHTHLAFSGERADEFEQRILGKTYLEIGQAGGGILSTVAKTRAASQGALLARCLAFLSEMISLGVTTVECKSGYGLDKSSELKILEVYQELSQCQSLTIVPTLLAAHTVPNEFRSNREEYINLICKVIIPEVAERNLSSFCDIFVEKSAFTLNEAERILAVARSHGMRLRLHVDQLSPAGGAELAARVKAVSADHLEYCSAAGMKALAAEQVIAVALPIASLYTFERAMDARALIESGVRVALASDFNPGSAPSCHLPFAMMLGCTLNRMTPHEVLKAVTCNAAAVLGLENVLGTLAPGYAADFAIIDAASINHWMYRFRENACVMTVKAGSIIHEG